MNKERQVLGFSGWSESGKTTLIEKLIPLLTKAGLRIAVIKHDGHEFEVDRMGSDSDRFMRAGAKSVHLTSDTKCVRFDAEGRTLAAMIRDTGDADLILVEGFKNARIPQIGVTSKRTDLHLPKAPEQYLAVASDCPGLTAAAFSPSAPSDHTAPVCTTHDAGRGRTPFFSLDDAEGICRFILEKMTEGALSVKTEPTVGVAVLCGGKSSRMGRPKEDIVIPWDGRTMLDRICDEMRFFDSRYLSVRAGQPHRRDDYMPVADLVKDAGPMGGLLSLLSICTTDALLVLACDMPCYGREQAEKMLSSYRGEDVLLLRSPRGPEPLASIYNKNLLPLLYRMITEGTYRMRALFDCDINIRIAEDGDGTPYRNVNCMSDFGMPSVHI